MPVRPRLKNCVFYYILPAPMLRFRRRNRPNAAFRLPEAALFAAGAPAEAPAEGTVHFLMAGEIAVDAFDADAAVVVDQPRHRAHAVAAAALGQAGFDLLALHVQCNHAVGGVPVGHALVDKGIDQHFADLRHCEPLMSSHSPSLTAPVRSSPRKRR